MKTIEWLEKEIEQLKLNKAEILAQEWENCIKKLEQLGYVKKTGDEISDSLDLYSKIEDDYKYSIIYYRGKANHPHSIFSCFNEKINYFDDSRFHSTQELMNCVTTYIPTPLHTYSVVVEIGEYMEVDELMKHLNDSFCEYKNADIKSITLLNK